MRETPLLHRSWALAAAILIALAAQALPLAAGISPVNEGRLLDPDGYMWLLRAETLHATGDWYDAAVPGLNAPRGETNHWSRPFDVILVAGATLAAPFVGDFREALFTWGVVVCPVLLVAAMTLFSWGSRPMLGSTHLVLAGVLLALALHLGLAFQFGRADHHALFMLLLIAHIGLMIRWIHAPSPRYGTAAGVLSALSLWIGVEGLATVLFFGGTLSVLAVYRGGGHLALLTRYAGTAAVSTACVLLVQVPPDQLLVPRSYQVSVSHATLFALGWLALRGARLVAPQSSSPRIRAAIVAGAGTSAGAAMSLIFPGFFEGPLRDFDTAVVGPWLAKVAEFEPLWPARLAELPETVTHLAPALVGATYAGWRWHRAEPRERDILLVLLLGTALFLILSLTAVRWSMYLGAFSLFLWPLAIATVVRLALSGWSRLPPVPRTFARAGLGAAVVFAVTVGPIVLQAGLAPAAGTAPDQPTTLSGDCPWNAMFRRMRGMVQEGRIAPDATVLTHTFRGPALVWTSGLRAVGAPYGNAAALTDTADVFGAVDPRDALPVLERRGVDLVLVCGRDRETSWYVGGADEVTLMERLIDEGAPPPWLRPIALEERLAPFRLYRVVGRSDAGLLAGTSGLNSSSR